MKKSGKKLLILIPVLCLSGCIGANWQVDIERADYVAKKISNSHLDEDFGFAKNKVSRIYFSEADFVLTETELNTTSSNKRTIKTNQVCNSVLMDFEHFTFYTVNSTLDSQEGSATGSKVTSEQWVYILDGCLIKAISQSSGKSYLSIELDKDLEVTRQLFMNYCITDTFDLNVMDYLGSDQLDVYATQKDVDDLNEDPNIDCSVKFYSRKEGTLAKEINTKYDYYDHHVYEYKTVAGEPVLTEVDNYMEYGNVREYFGWQDNFYTSYNYSCNLIHEKLGETTNIVKNHSKELVLEPTNTVDSDNPAYHKEYVFNYPNLKEFKLTDY